MTAKAALTLQQLETVASSFPVPYHLTWSIVDSTKLNLYAECPRKYFYEFVLGWRRPSHDLVFGRMFHEAMEQLYLNGLTADSAISAAEHFNKLWEEEYANLDMELFERFRPKTPDNVLRALLAYVKRYSSVWHKPRELELGGKVHISLEPERLMVFKMDWFGEHEHYGLCALEHKTTKMALSDWWARQFFLRLQLGTYNHAGKVFCGQEFFGVVVNGISICNSPRLKRDGEPYANSRDIELRQVPVNRSNATMGSWLFTVNALWDELEADFNKLLTCNAAQPTLECFRMNTNSCTNYGGCPFWDLCCARQNPLQSVASPPDGFHTAYWDPLNEIKHYKGVVSNAS
jgi:hypothetical protein